MISIFFDTKWRQEAAVLCDLHQPLCEEENSTGYKLSVCRQDHLGRMARDRWWIIISMAGYITMHHFSDIGNKRLYYISCHPGHISIPMAACPVVSVLLSSCPRPHFIAHCGQWGQIMKKLCFLRHLLVPIEYKNWRIWDGDQMKVRQERFCFYDLDTCSCGLQCTLPMGSG